MPPPSSLERFGRLGAIVALVVLAGVGIIGGASYLGRQVGSFTVDSGEDGADVEAGLEVDVVIPSGASAKDIAAILAAQGVVSSASQFETAVRAAGASSELRAGTYELITGMDSATVLDVLRAGPVGNAIRVTIPEGLRTVEIIARLAEATGQDEAAFEDALKSGAVTTSLRDLGESPELSDWEGLLFPDTYEITPTSSPVAVLQKLATTMEQRVARIDWSSFEDAGYDIYEGIVIASLIESEVRVADERPVVSSVIRNRLDEGMMLQIDATVLYALDTRLPGDFDSSVDSPYNTYRVTGLPPTPIAAPGFASLQAAAAPDETDFLFYVLSSADGSHTFTTNLDDHNAAVRKAREEGILP